MTAIAVGAPKNPKGLVGYLHMLPITATPPTDATTALGSDAVDLQFVTSDGVSLTSSLDTDMVQDWNLDDVLQIKKGASGLLEVSIFGWGMEQAKAVYGPDSVIGTETGFRVAWAGELPPHVFLVAELRGKNGAGRLVVDAQIKQPGQVEFKTDVPITHKIEASLFKNEAFKDAKGRASYFNWFDGAA